MPKRQSQLSCHERITIFSALAVEMKRMQGAQIEVERLRAAGVSSSVLPDDVYWAAELAALEAAVKKLRAVLS
jgi:hypothetical protein